MRTEAADPHPAVNPAPALLRRTPGLLLGPFYPLDMGAAGPVLWRGDGLPAGARLLQLDGRVVDRHGKPLHGVLVELWQADQAGRYPHPSAPDHHLVQPGFSGHGCQRTDADGRFHVRSLVPGAYREGDIQRAPHLHLQITGRCDRLVTQLFLPGHPGNAEDRWFRALARPALVQPDVVDDTAARLHMRWTAVLTQG